MAIRLSTLQAAASRGQSRLRNLSEAKRVGAKTAFLCHSHKDRGLATGFVNLMAEAGVEIYVDWADEEMPATPDRRTAQRIQSKIVELRYFFFLATENSMKSRWCPWEIGYADGKKPINQIVIIPCTDGLTIHGNEYLGLYRSIDSQGLGQLVFRDPATIGQVFNLSNL